jgi:hypothetical protein
MPARLRRLFEDSHVMWAAAGACAGVVACVVLTMGVVFAIDKRTSDSLAAIIDTIGNPGSVRNPLSPTDGSLLLPRVSHSKLSDTIGGDAVFALATVVNSEGRIADYEVLLSQYSREGHRVADVSLSSADASYVREAVRQTRFLPPQRVNGGPVAANMVWLLTRTTVKAPPLPFDFDEFREERAKARSSS